ncbi:MAG: carbohydrate binding family 9 domain-containing protein [Gemmatimonadetes bacterium]|nr:carbohydrate binding family 9 domain-containing protein [Gemmatimonadota bacterium]
MPVQPIRVSCTLAAIAALVGAAFPLSAQEGAHNHSSYRIPAVQVERGPDVDGVLDDEVWRSAAVISDFVQQEPNEGAAVSERTEVRILYDAETLYLALRAFDSQPDAVTATEMRRDSNRILDEDNFQIILDTFMDSRSAYMFVINPLGAQLDQQVSNEGEGARFGGTTSNINRDWDGVWAVSARRDEQGWVAEIAIPMVTLRFPESSTQSWGMNLMRNIGRKNEQAFWAPIPRSYTITRVSMAGALENLESLNRGRDLRIKPFATSGASRTSTGAITDDDFQGDIGLDVKYGVTAGLNLDLTVNTDFAQAEVDDEQVNLTRFELSYPEKRDFFLENSGQFNVGSATSQNRIVDLFFTRRIGLRGRDTIVPILGGARLTGKIGRNDISIMDVQTEESLGISGENFLVARYSRNFLSRSRVGGLVINREQTDSTHFNRTYAIDFSLAPLTALSAVGFIGRTQTYDVPSENYHDLGGYLNVTWLDRNWRIFGEYAAFGDDFNPEVGFLPRTGIRTTKIHFEGTPRPKILGIRDMAPMWNVTYTTDHLNRLLSMRLHHMVGTRFNSGANLTVWYNDNYERLVRPFAFNGVTVPVGEYRFGEWRVMYSSNPSRRFTYNAAYSPQEFYDGDRREMSGSLGLRWNDRLSSEVSYTRNEVDLAAGSFDLNLAAVRVDFAVSPTMSLRAVSQYTSTQITSNSPYQFGTSVRYRWTYRPGSDIYLVYDDLRRDPTGLPPYKERRLILKATHLLSR